MRTFRLLAAATLLATGCGSRDESIAIVFPASSVGAEAEILRRQVARFEEEHPGIRVSLRVTPDAADVRHQLYVQWLNAGTAEPDILQLDVIWTPEFASAGWILPLTRFAKDTSDFFPATLAANRWNGELHALPWFVDVGVLYWRTDLAEGPPSTLEELAERARVAVARGDVELGFAIPLARYEGLTCAFLEVLGAFGGAILDAEGVVAVDSPAAIRALGFLRECVEGGVVPRDALTWQEEPTRFAFQNGRAAFMRNWPYAYPLLENEPDSRVRGRFEAAPLPGAEGGRPTSALGGSQLAINARSRHPEEAWAVIEFLLRPEQMLERAQVAGQYPPRPSLYDAAELAEGLAIPPREARAILEGAVPRPVTPLYTELSSVLQVWLHRALAGEADVEAALREAAAGMRDVLDRHGGGE